MRRSIYLLTGVCFLIGLAACSTLPAAPATTDIVTAATATLAPSATATVLPTSAVPPTATAVPATAIPAGPTATPGPAPQFARIKMLDVNNGWATTDTENGGRILITKNGGMEWIDVTPKNVANLINSYGAFFLDTKTAWTIAGDLTQAARGSGKVLRTTDGGNTWQIFDAPFTTGNLTFIDAKNGWMRADPGCGAGNCYVTLFNTTDGGQTWNLMPVSNPYGSEANLTTGRIHEISGDDIAFTDPTTMWFGGNVLVSANTAIYYVSHDSGKTWTKVELPLPADAANAGAPVKVDLPVFLDAQNAIMAANYQVKGGDANNPPFTMVIYTSQDGGKTWKALPKTIAHVDAFTALDIVSAKDVFVRCGDNLCTTHDSAQTWKSVSPNLSFKVNDTNSVSSMDFVNATTGWSIVTDGTTYHLYQTQDGGVTWNELSVTVQNLP